jgi:nitroreductase
MENTREEVDMSEQAKDRIAFLRGVRTVRDFTADPVPEDALRDVLEVGRWTGTANNRQPAEVVVVRDAAARQKLTEYGANSAARAAAALVIVMAGDPERVELETFDEGRLAERLSLAAAAHGLGAGVTWLKGDGPERAKELLGIPREKRVRTVVAVGNRDEAAIRAKPRVAQPRREVGEFARWERY